MKSKRQYSTPNGEIVQKFKKGKKFLFVNAHNQVVLIQN
jgi:hypothetical protein